MRIGGVTSAAGEVVIEELTALKITTNLSLCEIWSLNDTEDIIHGFLGYGTV